MPRTNKPNRNANGNGSIRKKTVVRNGKEYTYWEGRCTVGYDSETGKQKQRSITGKTQKEVAQKLREISFEIDTNTYQAPSKLTLAEWLDTWANEYLNDVKPRTRDSYITSIMTHIIPALGATRLTMLKAADIQIFYNTLRKKGRSVPKHDDTGNIIRKDGKTVYEQIPMSPKSIKNIHGVLHKALQQAVELGYLRANPSTPCKLPRIEKTDIKPLDNEEISLFLKAIHGHKYESVYIVALFTGMREGEVLGLTWDCIDFVNGTISIKHQLQRERRGTGKYNLVSPKNGKSRRIAPAASVMKLLEKQQIQQLRAQQIAGEAWHNGLNLVFTNETGGNLSAQTIYLNFKTIMKNLGIPDTRFHDLRHSYAVAALQCGNDVKTVQETMGHFSAAFTLDVYGHVTDKMMRDSSLRMESYFQSVSAQ